MPGCLCQARMRRVEQVRQALKTWPDVRMLALMLSETHGYT